MEIRNFLQRRIKAAIETKDYEMLVYLWPYIYSLSLEEQDFFIRMAFNHAVLGAVDLVLDNKMLEAWHQTNKGS
jgi:hypothetical protein